MRPESKRELNLIPLVGKGKAAKTYIERGSEPRGSPCDLGNVCWSHLKDDSSIQGCRRVGLVKTFLRENLWIFVMCAVHGSGKWYLIAPFWIGTIFWWQLKTGLEERKRIDELIHNGGIMTAPPELPHYHPPHVHPHHIEPFQGPPTPWNNRHR